MIFQTIVLYLQQQRLNKMDKQIKEVRDYFAIKIVNGYYEIERVGKDESIMKILVDGKYVFTLLVDKSTGWDFFGTYNGCENFMTIEFNDNEKILGFWIAIATQKSLKTK